MIHEVLRSTQMCAKDAKTTDKIKVGHFSTLFFIIKLLFKLINIKWSRFHHIYM